MKKRLLDERDYSKPMKLTIENEIRKRIRDLYYELCVIKQNKEEGNKEKEKQIKLYLRILRKEKKRFTYLL